MCTRTRRWDKKRQKKKKIGNTRETIDNRLQMIWFCYVNKSTKSQLHLNLDIRMSPVDVDFLSRIATFFSVLSMFVTQVKQTTCLLLLNHFYPVTSYRRVRKESDELLYTVRSLVTVRATGCKGSKIYGRCEREKIKNPCTALI